MSLRCPNQPSLRYLSETLYQNVSRMHLRSIHAGWGIYDWFGQTELFEKSFAFTMRDVLTYSQVYLNVQCLLHSVLVVPTYIQKIHNLKSFWLYFLKRNFNLLNLSSNIKLVKGLSAVLLILLCNLWDFLYFL